MARGGSVAENRRARYLYEINESFEAGIVLVGSEIKSLRAGRVSISEAYVAFEQGEARLVNASIPAYQPSGRFGHEERRPRKLLLRRREIDRLAGEVTRKGMTVVPLRLYFNPRGIAKLEIGVGRGKKAHDKRETERRRDWQRQKQRLLRGRGH